MSHVSTLADLVAKLPEVGEPIRAAALKLDAEHNSIEARRQDHIKARARFINALREFWTQSELASVGILAETAYGRPAPEPVADPRPFTIGWEGARVRGGQHYVYHRGTGINYGGFYNLADAQARCDKLNEEHASNVGR